MQEKEEEEPAMLPPPPPSSSSAPARAHPPTAPAARGKRRTRRARVVSCLLGLLLAAAVPTSAFIHWAPPSSSSPSSSPSLARHRLQQTQRPPPSLLGVFGCGVKRRAPGSVAMLASPPASTDAQPTLLSFLTTKLLQPPSSSSSAPVSEALCHATDLALAIDSLAAACKRVSLAVRRAPLAKLTGYAGTATNVGGERQKKLDVLANDLIKASLAGSGRVAAYASEEEDGLVPLTAGAPFVVACDPLDGSSNVDCSVPTGTIFGLYRALGPGEEALHRSVLQRGKELVAGGYVLYAATTLLVLAIKGQGTYIFALDPAVGDFVLTRPRVQIPARGASYSLNEGREADWPDGLRRYVSDVKRGLGQTRTPYTLVYVCSLVADVHYVLLRGGMACNPRSHLRLIYEGNPMALVVEEAGGLSSTGGGPRERRILDVAPSAIHERIPTFVGSRDDILELESYGEVHQGGDKVYASVQS